MYSNIVMSAASGKDVMKEMTGNQDWETVDAFISFT